MAKSNDQTPARATSKIIRYGTRVIPPSEGICHECEQKMLEVTTCTVRTFTIEGKRFQRTPFGQEEYWADPLIAESRPMAEQYGCNDCSIRLGGYHHPYCDSEQCPADGHQLIGCHL